MLRTFLIALLFAVFAVAQAIGGMKPGEKCLSSAGYSWCEAKNKCLRAWEERCE